MNLKQWKKKKTLNLSNLDEKTKLDQLFHILNRSINKRCFKMNITSKNMQVTLLIPFIIKKEDVFNNDQFNLKFSN